MWRNLQVVLSLLCLGLGEVKALQSTAEQTVLSPIEVKAKKKGHAKSIEISESASETLEVGPNPQPSLAQVLQNSSAVFVQESGTQGAPHVILRAQDPSENRYFIEGVPLTDAQFNSDAIAVLPFQSVGRVDVYPEGVPAGLVSDGLGGAIDFHLEETPQSSIGLKTGNFGYWELFGKSSLGELNKNLTINFTRSDENYTYYDDGGTPFNTSSGTFKTREHNRFLRLGLVPIIPLYRTTLSSIRYFGVNSYRNLQTPGAISLPINGKLSQLFHLSALTGETWLNSQWKSKSLIYARLNSEEYRAQNRSKSLSTPNSNESRDRAIGVRHQLQYYSYYPIRIEQTLAGNYETYRLNSLEGENKNINHERWDVPISLAAIVPFNQWELRPAVIFQSVIYQGEVEKKYFLGSPRIGMGVNNIGSIKNLTWETHWGKFYRAPSMQEINGTPFGLASSFSLVPEKSDKVSTGLTYQRDGADSFVSEFRVAYNYSIAASKELITYIQNSQNSQVATNVGESLIQSHETSLEMKLFRLGIFQTRVTSLNTENLSALPYYYGKKIPNRPAFRLLQKLGYQNDRFGVSYQLQWVGERYLDLANTRKLSATTDHGFSLNYNPQGWGQWGLDVLNILDAVTAYSLVSGFQTIDNTTGYLGYPAPGRRIYLSWNYQL